MCRMFTVSSFTVFSFFALLFRLFLQLALALTVQILEQTAVIEVVYLSVLAEKFNTFWQMESIVQKCY